jgi:Signal transduction histidine kinase
MLSACRHTPLQDKIYLSKADSLCAISEDRAYVQLQKIKQVSLLSSEDKAKYSMVLSRILDGKGEFICSDSIIRVAVDYYSHHDDPEQAGYAYIFLSRVERNIGDVNGQARYLLMAMNYATKSQSDKLLGLVCAEKATFFEQKQWNQFDETHQSEYRQLQRDSMLYYHKLSLHYYKKIADNYNVILSLIYIGNSHYQMNQYNDALKYIRLAEVEAKIAQQTVLLSTIYRLYCGVYTKTKSYDKALFYIRKSMKTPDFMDYNKHSLAARVFLQMNQLDSAIHYAQRCINTGNDKTDCYAILKEVETKKQNYKEALRYAELYSTARDSVNQATGNESFSAIEKKYNFQRIDNENKQLTIHNQRYIIGVILLLALCMAIMFFFVLERRSKKRLAILKEKLRQTIAIKDKFFSIISHDLRNPVHAVHLTSGSLLEQYNELTDSDRLNAIKQINLAAGNVSKLLENLLMWALQQKDNISYRPKHIDLNLLAQQCTDLHSLAAKEKQITIQNLIKEETFIMADPNIMQTVIGNLISNAIKFSYTNGLITLSSRDLPDGKIEISIADQGMGMSETTRQKLFRLDTKLQRKGTNNEPGAGLGLILCYELITRQGGTINVTTKEGEGSIFSIVIENVNTQEDNSAPLPES